jgi:transcriptional regulator with XRE-family HTH domain
MPDQQGSPVVPLLPADFWEQPEVKSALLNRQFGRFLRVYRTIQSPQVKQADLATWIGVTQGQLSKLERAAGSPSDVEKLSKWARILGVPSDLLWFDPTPVAPTLAENASQDTLRPEGSTAIPRRDLLAATGLAAATAGATLIANMPWQRLRDSVDNGRPIDTATVQLMEDRTAEFFEIERTVPAIEIFDDLLKHRSVISLLIEGARTEHVRNRLAVLLGETDALRGWLLFDLGQGTDAANAWRSALKIAKETGDGALAACALGYWSYLVRQPPFAS